MLELQDMTLKQVAKTGDWQDHEGGGDRKTESPGARKIIYASGI